MEDKKMARQSMDSSLRKLWYLVDEDDKEETYVFDVNEFLVEFLLASASHTVVLVYSLDTFEEESKVFDFLKIKIDLFSYVTPLGTIFDEFRRLCSMKDDLFAYKLEVVEDFYFPSLAQLCDNLENGNLDIYER
nr:zf-BED domain-containing protein [Tanacetum cinerariifolium]